MEKHYSENYQDLFVLNILNNKANGVFVDIGSNHPVYHNNTFLLEEYGWNGISIELDSSYNSEYSKRKCTFINSNALEIDYLKLFKNLNINKSIDYLSLDIDESSTQILNLLPFNEFIFKIITIEHDGYRHGEKYREKQRKYLSEQGYKLLFGNVFAENFNGILTEELLLKNGKLPYEDWWVYPSCFDNDILSLSIQNIFPSQIIDTLTNRKKYV